MARQKTTSTITKLMIIILITGLLVQPAIDNDYTVQAASKNIKITYKANGGKFSSKKNASKKSYSKKIKKNKKVGKLPKVTKTGYTLKGWYTKKTTGKKVTGKTRIKKKTTLYARWTANSYTVSFHANGGTMPETTLQIKYNGIYGTMPTPTNGTHVFLGWYTAPSGGVKIEPSSKYKIASNTTLYARWSELSIIPDSIKFIGMNASDASTVSGWEKVQQHVTDPSGKIIALEYISNQIFNEPFSTVSIGELGKKTGYTFKRMPMSAMIGLDIYEAKAGNLYYTVFLHNGEMIPSSRFFISSIPPLEVLIYLGIGDSSPFA